jgi:hypothetical protein
MPVQINPKGQHQHDHRVHAKIHSATMYQLEALLGQPHAHGDGLKISNEWFLVTDHGSAVIHDHWSFNEGEYAILTSNERAALLVVEWLRQNGIQAYNLYGGMGQ